MRNPFSRLESRTVDRWLPRLTALSVFASLACIATVVVYGGVL